MSGSDGPGERHRAEGANEDYVDYASWAHDASNEVSALASAVPASGMKVAEGPGWGRCDL